MTGLSTYLTKAPAPYWLHLHKHGIGGLYVAQDMLDDPPPVGRQLLTIPQALAKIGKAIDGEAWKDWERTTLYFPSPVLAPSETLSGLLVAAEKTAPVKPPPALSDVRSNRRARDLPDYAELRRAWDAKAPERIAAVQKDFEKISDDYRNWQAGQEEHASGVAALHRVYKELANAVADGRVKPWFFVPETGEKALLRSDWLLRPAAITNLVRHSKITNFKGESTGIALVPVDELEAAFPLSASDAGTRLLLDGKAIDIERLSPFLRLAIHVAVTNDVDADYRAKKENLTGAITDAMEDFGLDGDALGATATGYLATFIRWPDAQKGRAEVKGQTQKK